MHQREEPRIAREPTGFKGIGTVPDRRAQGPVVPARPIRPWIFMKFTVDSTAVKP